MNCKFCQKELNSSNKNYCNSSCYAKDNKIIIICEVCGIEKKTYKRKIKQKTCSAKCSAKLKDYQKIFEKRKKTLKNKYGVDVSFKVKGYENLNINLIERNKKIKNSWNKKTKEDKKEIGNKISITLLNKTTEEKKEIKNKRENTTLLRYGVSCSLNKNSPLRYKVEYNSREKFKNFLFEYLKNHNLELIEEYKGVKDEKGNMIYYKFKHIPSNNIFVDHLACGRLPIYKDSNETIGISNQEKELQQFIKEIYFKEIIFNNRKLIKGSEVDIYLPDINLAIDYNGIYWHSELNGKLRSYHIWKTEECEKQNIQLIQIFEDEWINKKEIVKSKIKSLLGITQNKIYARKCEIKEITSKESNLFLNQNHIQGEDKSKIKLGLYNKGILISVMTFGALRKITGNNKKENEWELIRYASLLNTSVIGGASKLLKFFIKNYNPHKLISYADRRYSKGNLYKKLGFNFIYNTPPNYWYMKYYKQREHRYKYRKSELVNILTNYNPQISEWENMKLNKYDRIWDCGSKKYELVF